LTHQLGDAALTTFLWRYEYSDRKRLESNTRFSAAGSCGACLRKCWKVLGIERFRTPFGVCELAWPSALSRREYCCRLLGAYWFRPGRYVRGGMPRMVRWPR